MFSSHSSSPRGTACSSDENNTWEGGVWNHTLSLRRFLLPLRHEGGAIEAWVPAESDFRVSDSRSRQLWEKLEILGVVVGSVSSGVSTHTVLGPLGARSPVPDICPSAPFTWEESLYSAGGRPPPPVFPAAGGNFAGNVLLRRICKQLGDSSPLPRPGGGGLITPRRVRLHRRPFLQGSLSPIP